jgi:hypothetical protein
MRLTLPTIVGGLLLALGVARLLAEVPLLWELEARDNGEPVLYSHAMRLLHGEALYQPYTSAPYAVTAYMPAYYAMAAALHALFGSTFFAGRLVTLLASSGLAIATALLARRLHGGVATAMLATGLVLTLGFAGPPGPPWLALYRVDPLGVAAAVGAVATLAGGTGYRRVVAAGLLAALALSTKQTLCAAVLAGGLWLFEQDRRKAVVFGLAALGPVLLLALAVERLTGAFIQNITGNVNPFDVASLELSVVILAIFQLGPLAAALVFLRLRGRGRAGSTVRLVVYYWCAALLPMLGMAKIGSWHNYWIEWSVPTAILAAAGLSWLAGMRPHYRPWAFVVSAIAVVGSTLMATVVAAWSGQTALAATSDQASRSAELSQVVACVRAAPGDAIAMPMDVVALADKRILVEPISYTIFADAGMISTGPLIAMIQSGQIGVVVMDLRSDAPQWQHGAGQPIWRDDVLAAMRESMTLRSEKGGRMIYTPRGSQPPSECT